MHAKEETHKTINNNNNNNNNKKRYTGPLYAHKQLCLLLKLADKVSMQPDTFL